MDLALIEAIHANKLMAAERVAHINPRSSHDRCGGCYVINTAEPTFDVANSATPLPSAGLVDVSAVVSWFRQRSTPFHFVVRPEIDQPLYEELIVRGFTTVPSERVCVLTEPVPPLYDGPLAIREVADAAEMQGYGQVGWHTTPRIGRAIAETAARLGFILVLGEYEGQPIACSMAALTGRVAGLYNVAVEEPFRRQGFGEAITWAAIGAAMRLGAETVWLGASDAGLSVYKRMGFVEHFDYLHMQQPT